MTKKCPFCGGNPAEVVYEGYDVFWHRYECAKCGATPLQLSLTSEEALHFWNKSLVLERIRGPHD